MPKFNLLIEYNGKQHYKSIEYFGGGKSLEIQQKRDFSKKQYCIKNNIKLIEISYLDFNNIEEILSIELNINE